MSSVIYNEKVVRTVKRLYVVSNGFVKDILWFFVGIQSDLRTDIEVESFSEYALEPFHLMGVSSGD